MNRVGNIFVVVGSDLDRLNGLHMRLGEVDCFKGIENFLILLVQVAVDS